MLRVERSADGGDRADRLDPACGLKHCGSTQGVADQDSGGLQGAGHVPGRSEQIVDVGCERRIDEVACTLPQASKIETQHSDALLRERAADVHGRFEVLGAGEAMGE